jgi:Outer membrane protein beta-barrel family/CarboxypepD_reg-like domain
MLSIFTKNTTKQIEPPKFKKMNKTEIFKPKKQPKQLNKMNSFNKLLFLSIFGTQIAFSQHKISGSIADANGKALPFVTVGLLKTDSTIVKATATDQNGHFEMNKVSANQYILKASYVGFQNYFSKTIEISDSNIELPTVVLSENSIALNEVAVVSKKAVFEQLLDRSVMNVANSIVGSSGTALDVLAKVPGISVDYQKEQIELRGKEGVLVQIDGKTTYLSGPDLTGMLKGMSSDNIDKIEVITNPSAKYDAAGNAGIINIRLKKNTNLGSNGMYSLGLGTGAHFRGRSSLGLNHRSEKLNIYGNYSLNKGGNFFDLAINRNQPDGTLTNIITQNTHLVYDLLAQNAKLGLDYQVNKNTNIGIAWTVLWSDLNQTGLASFNARRSTSLPIYSKANTNKSLDDISQNHLANFNIQHSFKNKSQFSADIDYGYFDKNFSNTLNTSTIINDENAEKLIPQLVNKANTTININTVKADYSLPLSKIWKFETGLKYANVVSKNDVKLKSGDAGNLVIDPTLTNDFEYTERVNAGYINIAGKIKKAEVQAGLRAEHTHSFGDLSNPKQVNERNYLNWFPSLFISKALSEKQTIFISYSHRIDRPNYQNINPARSFVDLFAYSTGNIDLKPQYTHAFELRYAHKKGANISMAVNHVSDLILNITNVSEGNKIYRSSMNFGDSKGYIFTISQPFTVNKNWQIQSSLTGNYTLFKFDYEGKTFHAKNISSRLNFSNGFVLPNGFTAELNGWVNSPSVVTIMENSWLSNVDAGLQKTIAKKIKMKLSAQNIFNTPLAKSVMHGNTSFQQARLTMDTRVVMLNMSLIFGNQKVKAANQRKAGMEEENKRAN